MGLWAALTIIFGAVAVTFRRLRLSEPGSADSGVPGLAVVATAVCILLMVVG